MWLQCDSAEISNNSINVSDCVRLCSEANEHFIKFKFRSFIWLGGAQIVSAPARRTLLFGHRVWLHINDVWRNEVPPTENEEGIGGAKYRANATYRIYLHLPLSVLTGEFNWADKRMCATRTERSSYASSRMDEYGSRIMRHKWNNVECCVCVSVFALTY